VIARILSGGQTGADRAALDVAAELGISTGGWVPRGRAAEDGVVPARYGDLRETESDDPAERTRLNVRDADAIIAITHGEATGGTRLALDEAARRERPALHLDLDAEDEAAAAERLLEWLGETWPSSLNVAGPRVSEDPAIHAAVVRVLQAALPPLLLRAPEILETERLHLRPPAAGDLEAVLSYARDPDVTQYLQWRPHSGPDDTREFLARCAEVRRAGDAFPWALVPRDGGDVIGMVELRLRGATANLGYVLAREHWGRGLTPEAVARVRDWVLESTSVRRLWAICDAENHGSSRVLEKCGFTREAGVRHEYHPNAGPDVRECLSYAIERKRLRGDRLRRSDPA
jgi:RimJ/RimL family protein N-acetyltransferase